MVVLMVTKRTKTTKVSLLGMFTRVRHDIRGITPTIHADDLDLVVLFSVIIYRAKLKGTRMGALAVGTT